MTDSLPPMTTAPNLSAAIERAAEAIADAWSYDEDYQAPTMTELATAALTAALPIIEQMHRAAHAGEFATAIDAADEPEWIWHDTNHGLGWNHAQEYFAELVRGLAAGERA